MLRRNNRTTYSRRRDVTNKPKSDTSQDQSTPRDRVKVLVVVEGNNDVEFLRRISAQLHVTDSSLPNLDVMERRGELIFIPFGGGHVREWTDRLAPLGIPECHIYDHELPPESDYRNEAAQAVNDRNHCRAFVTRKRSLENYLHPRALLSAADVNISFDDFDPAPAVVAKRLYQLRGEQTPWELLSRRTQNRMTHRAKRWLNTAVVDHMTVHLLAERDPDHEIIGWMKTITRLATIS